MSNNALTGASVPCLWQITYSFPFPGRPVNVLAVRSEVFKAKKKGEVDETQRMKRNHSQIHHSVSVHTTLPCSGLAFTSSCHSSGSVFLRLRHGHTDPSAAPSTLPSTPPAEWDRLPGLTRVILMVHTAIAAPPPGSIRSRISISQLRRVIVADPFLPLDFLICSLTSGFLSL